MINLTIAIGALIVAYLLGSVNFAVIIGKIFLGKDVRKEGSGNAGATNVLRSAGIIPGLLTFLFDAFKGFLACFIGKQIFEYLSSSVEWDMYNPSVGGYLCLVCVMLGHVFPIFFGFKGGKAVAVSVGTYAVCCYPAILLGLLAFVVVLLISRMVSLSSLVATVTVVGSSIVFMDFSTPFIPQIICTLLAGTIVFVKHKENIIRLKNGTEKKMWKGKAK